MRGHFWVVTETRERIEFNLKDEANDYDGLLSMGLLERGLQIGMPVGAAFRVVPRFQRLGLGCQLWART